MKYLQGLDSLDFFQLPSELNPFHEDAEVFGVSAARFPGGSKFITIRGMLASAYEHGHLKGVKEFVEATSGNSGLALAVQGPRFGVSKATLVISPDIPAPKRTMLHLAGARTIPPAEGLNPIKTARLLGGGGWEACKGDFKHNDGVLNLDQYANPGNWVMHSVWTGPNIVNELGKVDVFASSLGTGGTIIGIGNCLKQKTKTKIVGVACAPTHEIPGVRDEKRLAEVSLPWKAVLDGFEKVEQKQAYAAACWLNQIAGQPVGPSGGMSLAGLFKHFTRNGVKKKSNGEKLRAVFFVPDGPDRYADRFEANLPNRFFNGRPIFPLPWESVWGEWNL